LVSGSGTSATECVNGHSECSEQTTSDGPVLEEFIPLKRSDSVDDDGDEHEESSQAHVDRSGKKSDWLRSVQLWNPDPPSAPEVGDPTRLKLWNFSISICLNFWVFGSNFGVVLSFLRF